MEPYIITNPSKFSSEISMVCHYWWFLDNFEKFWFFADFMINQIAYYLSKSLNFAMMIFCMKNRCFFIYLAFLCNENWFVCENSKFIKIIQKTSKMTYRRNFWRKFWRVGDTIGLQYFTRVLGSSWSILSSNLNFLRPK